MKSYYLYLMMSHNNNVIYTGISDNLIRRVYEHKNKLGEGFARKYNAYKLVYFEQYDNPLGAISREKQIKAGSRQRKLDLIGTDNPNFKDLYEEIIK